MKNLFLFTLLSLGVAFAYSQSVIGVWKTIDDKDGKPSANVEIYEKNGKYFGKVVHIYDPKDVNNLCTECKGDKYNKKILGMVILTNLNKIGNKYEGGKILDPDNGEVYSCNMELIGNNKLKVRGYLGFSLLGRTQYWQRVVGK